MVDRNEADDTPKLCSAADMPEGWKTSRDLDRLEQWAQRTLQGSINLSARPCAWVVATLLV